MAGAKTTVITYNGIDGACSAAMALVKYPRAEVLISSANRVGNRIASLAKLKNVPAHIMVCGLGLYSDWGPIIQAGKSIRRKGGRIQWYCGRKYLESDRDKFQQFCEPVFLKARTNTEAVCRHLGLDSHARAEFLLALAEHDENNPVAGHGHKPSDEEMLWVDRLLAAISRYFKYQDENAYASAIQKLAADEWDATDQWAVDMFRRSGFKNILDGTSDVIKQLRRTIGKVGAVHEPVLILGESGVGKERVANLIHERSREPAEAFVPVNCATFAGNAGLANSILFGHLKGAFTGAIEKRDGAFVRANGGILFLDELGELPLDVQAKLLRVLDDGEVTPVGADEPVCKVDVRVIAATNRDLPAMIRRGEFRADLFHRLSTLRIHVSPLREREEDIARHVENTLADLAEDGRGAKLSTKDLRSLRAYAWPGNVRQLIKVVKRAVYLDVPVARIIDEERALGVLDAVQGDATDTGAFLPTTLGDVRPLREIQAEYAHRAWELHSRNYSATAKSLGIAQNTLLSPA